jgi:hypothetical protein
LLDKGLLYTLSRIGDKKHAYYLTHRPFFTSLVSPCCSFILSLLFMHNFLVNLLSCKSIPVSFRIWINSVQFIRSSVFYHSKKHANNSFFMSKVFYTIISIPIASLFPFPLLNPN